MNGEPLVPSKGLCIWVSLLCLLLRSNVKADFSWHYNGVKAEYKTEKTDVVTQVDERIWDLSSSVLFQK